MINFISESGSLDIFLFGSTLPDSPRQVSTKLSTIFGFQAMVQYHNLGYHYSKWERETSASYIINYNEKFELNKFPVDVFWLDISYAKEARYFIFDPDKFSTKGL